MATGRRALCLWFLALQSIIVVALVYLIYVRLSLMPLVLECHLFALVCSWPFVDVTHRLYTHSVLPAWRLWLTCLIQLSLVYGGHGIATYMYTVYYPRHYVIDIYVALASTMVTCASGFAGILLFALILQERQWQSDLERLGASDKLKQE